MTRLDFLFQDLISCDNILFLVTRINFFHEILESKTIIFTKPQLAHESRYLGRNIGRGSEVPTKRSIFCRPDKNTPIFTKVSYQRPLRGGGGVHWAPESRLIKKGTLVVG